MSVRLRRLQADYEKICTAFTKKSRIRVLKTVGTPPEKYQLEFLVTGLQKNLSTGKLRSRNTFIAEITLTGSYPRMAPQCKMLTPVFHPNIAPHAICIGDHWAAGESLSHLIVRIGEMISYQSYNLKSPLNGEAAKWTDKNRDRLPLDEFDFTSLLDSGEVLGRNADGTLKAGTTCANCGSKGEEGRMQVCSNQHVTCPDCALECPVCGCLLCLKCTLEKCSVCGRSVCPKCIYNCPSCNQLACTEHVGVCHVCRKRECENCLVTCDLCGRTTCIEHISKMKVMSKSKYVCSKCAF